MAKKIIVVGASSGIGKEIATQLIAEGHQVAAFARREKELKKIAPSSKTKNLFVKHDVTEYSKVPGEFSKAVKALGGLDEIYYASGVMHRVGPEEFPVQKDLEMLEVNLLGCVAWLDSAAAYFQEKKAGKIIGISSIAGDRGRRGNPVYNASKAGMSTYLEALRNRLAVQGIQVVTVKPGMIQTPMTEGLSGLMWLITAKEAAQVILAKVNAGREVFYVPARWAIVSLIIRLIPSFIFRRLSV
ncbi:SDR family NAD(P)-dependent oxidoreductase [Leptospira langatensis]|uniref:SDR family NAD(P)-dependent oxidoreductase n=1 Tax=Leptospira langatensis TaxID=2484983 RepID=A0A5F1ZQW2_9LEPT|nr:SDR family NAD(P)-dependent oxidoreductase [Leptospira langatensis]TGK05527.1 SDR family NAD(P)-dependent oxidoreductase [Leptospira langatensis]TGL38663.1 SDR family NAD(P)-dependent oxidoreductase [Leptospira langatensis]